jgi:hypothetical protein
VLERLEDADDEGPDADRLASAADPANGGVVLTFLANSSCIPVSHERMRSGPPGGLMQIGASQGLLLEHDDGSPVTSRCPEEGPHARTSSDRELER